jgi:hypothetical protein
MQKAIELNDNRGVYRSKLLLDEDLAARAVSLARIYDDLGFDQPAVNQSSTSLDIDPSNYSAHRFLADAYFKRQRHEAARASEILQAQLLQPIVINPVQPEASETNLNILAGTSPSSAGFNEFTSLFERNGIQFHGAGIIGNNNTFSDQAVISGIFDNFSYSFGQFHYATDGFRENNELRHRIINAFGQINLSDSMNFQIEYSNRKSEEGDLRLRFDEKNFSRDSDREIDREVFRAGAKFTFSPNSQFITNLQYIDRRERFSVDAGFRRPTLRKIDVSEQGYDFQAQYLFKHEIFNFKLGGGFNKFDGTHQRAFLVGQNFERLLFDATEDNSSYWHEVYLYSNILMPRDITWTFGLSYTSLKDGLNKSLDLSSINPKFGFQWKLTNWAHLRLATFRSTKRPQISENTLQNTQIAGFNQFLDDFDGTRSRFYGIGFDLTPTKNLLLGFEISARDLKVPFSFDLIRVNPDSILTTVKFEDQRENSYRAYINWTPNDNWSLSTEYQVSTTKRSPVTNRFPGRRNTFISLAELPTRLRTDILPIRVRYFNKYGFFASLTGTYVKQKLGKSSIENSRKNYSNFFLVDTSIGYRLPKKFGILSLQVKNIFDRKFNYQDTNSQSADPSGSAFIPDRTILGQLLVNF